MSYVDTKTRRATVVSMLLMPSLSGAETREWLDTTDLDQVLANAAAREGGIAAAAEATGTLDETAPRLRKRSGR